MYGMIVYHPYAIRRQKVNPYMKHPDPSSRILRAAAALLLLTAFLLPSCADVGFSSASEMPHTGVKAVYAPDYSGETMPQAETAGQSEATSAAAVTTEAPKKADTVISFLAAGDNIIHEAVFTDAHARITDPNGHYNFKPMYDGIAPLIAAADVSYVNQEGPMAGPSYGYYGYPNFNAPQEAGDTLVDLGFDVVNIANNHMLDKWEKGLLKTVDYWKTKDVLLIGAYLNAADYDDIRVLECKGVKIAFLSYTYGTNGMTLDEGSETVIPLINDSDIRRQTALAREKADLVFVSMHWGIESDFMISAEQNRVAQLLCDCGADVIIGMHPHVLQEAGWLTAEDGHRTFCTYSIGNMLSTMLTANYMVGALLTFDIRVSGETGECSIEKPVLLPIVCHYDRNRANLQIYRLEDYTEELADAHGAQLNQSFTLQTLYGYVTEHVDKAYLPAFCADK